MAKTVRPDSRIRPYVDHLNRLLNTTITGSRLSSLRSTSDVRIIARYESSDISPLELESRGWLHFRQAIGVRPDDGKIIVLDASYQYSRSANPDDENAWVFRHHYHREGRPNQPQSHYHVNAAHPGTGRFLGRLHFPTGRVSLEQIVAHLLLDQKVPPLRPLDEALTRLRDSHVKFMALRTDDPLFPQPSQLGWSVPSEVGAWEQPITRPLTLGLSVVAHSAERENVWKAGASNPAILL